MVREFFGGSEGVGDGAGGGLEGVGGSVGGGSVGCVVEGPVW